MRSTRPCARNGPQAETLEERKRVAREMQQVAWEFVPVLQLGTWVQPVLYRANLKGLQQTPFTWFVNWWSVEKT
jgi:peptide/nickel transport system substrate-binding protein